MKKLLLGKIAILYRKIGQKTRDVEQALVIAKED
jgi:hypothetical protein